MTLKDQEPNAICNNYLITPQHPPYDEEDEEDEEDLLNPDPEA